MNEVFKLRDTVKVVSSPPPIPNPLPLTALVKVTGKLTIDSSTQAALGELDCKEARMSISVMG